MSVERDCRILAERVIQLLEQERKRRGLSKYAVAARSGLSEQTIGYVERRLRSPSFETILRIAHGMEVSLEQILKEARKS